MPQAADILCLRTAIFYATYDCQPMQACILSHNSLPCQAMAAAVIRLARAVSRPPCFLIAADFPLSAAPCLIQLSSVITRTVDMTLFWEKHLESVQSLPCYLPETDPVQLIGKLSSRRLPDLASAGLLTITWAAQVRADGLGRSCQFHERPHWCNHWTLLCKLIELHI